MVKMNNIFILFIIMSLMYAIIMSLMSLSLWKEDCLILTSRSQTVYAFYTSHPPEIRIRQSPLQRKSP